ncbi:MAG TPA: hypothetical protein VIR54_26515 [Vicinamibacterales bacterium]|jgi:hypothetical protein
MLPNGLHDAELVKVDIDYEGRRVIFEMNLDVSRSPDAEVQYRRGRIIFSDVAFIAVRAAKAGLKTRLYLSIASRVALNSLPGFQSGNLPALATL